MEIEIKIAPVSEKTADRIFADPSIAPHLEPAELLRMRTLYYDNAAGDLQSRYWTLRLRRENDRSICTFKAKVSRYANVELECEAQDIASGIQGLLTQPELPADAAETLRRGGFSPLCSAEFTRRVSRYEKGDFAMQLTYDRGYLEKGPRQAPLCEIEVELLHGDEAQLHRLADMILNKYSLKLCERSKQQRAMGL